MSSPLSLVNSSLSFIKQNYFAGKPEWTIDQVPDLTGIVVIVTGANSGIGKETARVLLKNNAKVYIASRSRSKSEEAIKKLQEETGKEAYYLELDLSSLKSVKAAAEDFQRRETQLHILFNNAGSVFPPIDQVTAEGFDMQFGTNVLGHFYFTKLLLPTLISTAEADTTPSKKVRVVNTASFGHHFFPKLDFDTFKDGPKRRKLGTATLYNQSKFGNIVFSNELARRYGEKGIVSTSLHPGAVDTDFTRYLPKLAKVVMSPGLHPVAQGALTQLRAGTSPEGVEWNGKYLIPWGRLGQPQKSALDEDLGKQLWDYMEEQVKDI